MSNKNLNVKVDVLNLENIREAFRIANNALYFDDSSDYGCALWGICEAIAPDLTEYIGTKYIEEGEEIDEIKF